jgi:hypothetical protein
VAAIFLIPLLILGVFAAIVALVVYAIVKNRPGIAAATGGGLLLLMVFGALLALFSVRSSSWTPNDVVMSAPSPPAYVQYQPVSVFPGQASNSSERISWIALAVIIAVPLVLLSTLFRRASNNAPCGRRGRSWGWVALALLAVLVVGSWFVSRTTWQRRDASMAFRRSADAQAAIARRQSQLQRHAVELNSQVQQIAEVDIHKLMDKVDAPRIPLAASPPSPPLSPQPTSVVAESDVGKSKDDKDKKEDAQPAAEAKAAVDVMVAEEETADKSVAEAEAAEDVTGERIDGADADSTRAEDAEPTDDEPQVEEPLKDNKRAAASPSEAPAVEATPLPASKPAAPRPSWVDHPPKRVGDTAREVIVTDEYATVDECTRATDVYLLLKTYERVMELAGKPVFDASLPSLAFNNRNVTADGRIIISSDGGRTWNWNDPRIAFLNRLGIDVPYVRREIVAKDGADDAQYFETVQRSFGPMHKLYTQIEFTPSVDNELRRRWEAYERTYRLAAVGTGAGGIVGLLGLVYGLLKVDTWTNGYYTKRLFLGVPAAIIGLGALFALMAS